MRAAQGVCVLAVALVAGLTAASPVRADVTVAEVFAEHMVLQRDKPAPVWGWAEPGQKVTVGFAGQRKSAVAGEDGTRKK